MRRVWFLVVGALVFIEVNALEVEAVEDLAVTHRVITAVTYLVAEGVALKLDAYVRNLDDGRAEQPAPVIVWFHGGGWIYGRRETAVLELVHYMMHGWSVVTVDYRTAENALAPAAVEDALCAVWWVKRNAKKLGFDPDRIVVGGASAGGHLALLVGILPAAAGLDYRCAGPIEAEAAAEAARGFDFRVSTQELKVAAIVNWYGVTDLQDQVSGPGARTYGRQWMGVQPNRTQLAALLSPLSHIREGLPPTITIHGDDDQLVPYWHALRLHELLDAARVPNRLITVLGGGHGRFSREERRNALNQIDQFLSRHFEVAEDE